VVLVKFTLIRPWGEPFSTLKALSILYSTPQKYRKPIEKKVARAIVYKNERIVENREGFQRRALDRIPESP
jgi:hypothetical protein